MGYGLGCAYSGGGDALIAALEAEPVQPKPAPKSRKRKVKVRQPSLHVFMGFDSEYVRAGDSNRVLSYQLFLPGPDVGLLHVPGKNRLTVSQLAQDGAELVREALGRWPTAITFVGHFVRADLSTLADLHAYREYWQVLQGTLKTRKAIPIKFNDAQRHPHKIFVQFTDSKLMTSGGLDDLGQALGLPKLRLPNVLDESGELVPAITRMDLLLEQEPLTFLAYAMRDAEVSVKGHLGTLEVLEKLGIPPSKAPTISSVSAAMYRNDSQDPDYELRGIVGWQDPARKRTPIYHPQFAAMRDLATRCYHGGLNVCALNGVFPGLWWDVDRKAAYPSALAMTEGPDYDTIEACNDLEALLAAPYAVAACQFEFPASVRWPCLPVNTEVHGLIYPSATGPLDLSYCTGPELRLAVELGAAVRLLSGFKWQGTGRYPYRQTHIQLCELRAKAKAEGNKLQEQLFKLANNSGYGRTAMGLTFHTTYDPGQDANVITPESRVTNPLVAGYVTGLVRAAICEWLNCLEDQGYRVASATTDGFLTEASPEVLAKLQPGEANTVMDAGVQVLYGPDAKGIEIKHAANGMLMITTRAGVGLEAVPGYEQVSAGGSLYIPASKLAADTEDPVKVKNDYVYKTWAKRKPGDTHLVKSFSTVREMFRQEKDLVDVWHQVTLNFEYDYKRRPVKAQGEGLEFRFRTEPWPDMEAYRKHRRALDVYRKTHTLQSEQDLREIEQLAQLGIQGGKVGRGRAISEAGLQARTYLQKHPNASYEQYKTWARPESTLGKRAYFGLKTKLAEEQWLYE